MSPAALSEQVETSTQTPHHPFITMPLEPNRSIPWSCSLPRETAEPCRLSAQDLMRSAYKIKKSFFHPPVTTSDQRAEAPAEFDWNPPSHRHRVGKRIQALLSSTTTGPFVTQDITEILATSVHGAKATLESNANVTDISELAELSQVLALVKLGSQDIIDSESTGTRTPLPDGYGPVPCVCAT